MEKRSKLIPGARVWITARHSPGKSQSIEAQLTTLREYCDVNQLVVAHEFIDRGVSGYDTQKRDAFREMLSLIEDNKKRLVDGIICYDSSRLAREFNDATWARALLQRRGYVLEILIGDDYPDGLSGYIMRGAQDYFNAEQIAIMSQKSRDGLRVFCKLKDDDGKYFAFWPMGVPWGFKSVFKELPVVDTMTGKKRVKRCIEPDYDLWPLGRELFRLRAEGLSYPQIEERTGWLYGRGTVDISKSDIVGRMYYVFFRHTIYFGQMRMKELIIDDYVPAMVDRETWIAANATAENFRRGNWRGSKAGKTKDVSASLAGLCFCGLCDSLAYHTTTATARNKLRYYLCSLKRRQGTDSCPNRAVRADTLEKLVKRHALSVYLDPDFTMELIERINAILGQADNENPDIERLSKELTELNWSINNLIKMGERVRSESELDELSSRLRVLQDQRDDVKSRFDRLSSAPKPQPIRAAKSDILAQLNLWRHRLDSETKQVFWQIISKVVLGPETATIYYRKPLCFYDNYPLAVVGFEQGFLIELPAR